MPLHALTPEQMENVRKRTWELYMIRDWSEIPALIRHQVNITDEKWWKFQSKAKMMEACNDILTRNFGCPPMPIPKTPQVHEVDQSAMIIHGVLRNLRTILRPCFPGGSESEGANGENGHWLMMDDTGTIWSVDDVDGAVPYSLNDD
jgi:hypothetical protein